MKKFWKGKGKTIVTVSVLGLVLVTAAGCGNGFQDLADLPGQIAEGEFNIDTDELEDMFWDEEWTTYDVSSMTTFNEAYPIIKEEDFYEDTLSADGIVNLSLELGGCEVKVEGSPDADLHVTAENISAFQAFTEDDTFYVKGIQTGTWTGGLNTNMKITLQIPEGTVYESVAMSLGAGDFQLSNLTTNSVHVQVGAGKLQFAGLETENLILELGAGQAVIEDADVTGNAELKVGAGELVFKGNIPGDLQAECAMGNMEIHILGSEETDHNLALSCVAGNLTIGSTVYSGVVDRESDNHAHSDYELECAMGNLTLVFE